MFALVELLPHLETLGVRLAQHQSRDVVLEAQRVVDSEQTPPRGVHGQPVVLGAQASD